MNNPFGNMYLSLMKRILELGVTVYPTESASPIVQYIDMDYGQLESKERPAVAFPCVLIDFKDWVFQDMGNLVQSGKGNVCFKIAKDPYDNSSSITPESYMEAAIDVLDLEQQIFQLLQGWHPVIEVDGATPPNPTKQAAAMTRIYATPDNRRPGIKVKELTFRTSFTDFSAKRPFAKASAVPSIADNIDLTLKINT